MPFTNYFYDDYVAPKFSELTENNAIHLSLDGSKDKFWLQNYVLNSCFIFKSHEKLYLYQFNYLRRVQAAFYEYESACNALEGFINMVNAEEPVISLYMKALYHFEATIAQSYQAYSFLKTFTNTRDIKLKKKKKYTNALTLFENEGPLYSNKLERFYNFSKHMDFKINEEYCNLRSGVPLWITNSGLEYQENKTSKIRCLKWDELNTILSDLAGYADFISSEIFRLIKKKQQQDSKST